MQLFMEERIDKKLSIFAMQITVYPDHSALEVCLAVVAHTIVDNPTPRSVIRSGGQDGRLRVRFSSYFFHGRRPH